MIVLTVFLSILNQMYFHLVENQKENCHRGHIPFNVKINGNIVLSVYQISHLFAIFFAFCLRGSRLWV